MTVGSFIAIYFVVWWTILFAVLPWGVRTQEEEGDVVLGTERSAPARPMLIRKAFATSIVAAILVFGGWWLLGALDLDMARIAEFFGFVGAKP
jgi:predicted secreted protein